MPHLAANAAGVRVHTLSLHNTAIVNVLPEGPQQLVPICAKTLRVFSFKMATILMLFLI